MEEKGNSGETKKQEEELPEEKKEKVEEVVEEARKVEAKTERLLFLTKIKRLGVVLGGALLFVGFMLLLSAFLVFFELIDVSSILKISEFTYENRVLFTIFFSSLGILDILGGLVLAAK